MLGLGVSTTKGGTLKGFLNNYSVDFDGINDYISIAQTSTYSFGDGASTDSAFSVSAWINMDDATKCRIVAKSGAGTGNIEWLITTNSNDYFSLYLYDYAGAVNISAHTAAITSAEGSWTHVAATYDGGGANTDINLYVDGTNANDSVGAAGSYAAMHTSAADLDIGRFLRGGTVDYGNGKIDEVSLWNVELTSGQISAIYNDGTPTNLAFDSNLIGYWRMEENTGTTVKDSSTNSNTGTLTNNAAWSEDAP